MGIVGGKMDGFVKKTSGRRVCSLRPVVCSFRNFIWSEIEYAKYALCLSFILLWLSFVYMS